MHGSICIIWVLTFLKHSLHIGQLPISNRLIYKHTNNKTNKQNKNSWQWSQGKTPKDCTHQKRHQTSSSRLLRLTCPAISSRRSSRMAILSSPTAALSTSRPGSRDRTNTQYRWSRTAVQMPVTRSRFCRTTLTSSSRKNTPASSSYWPPCDPCSSAPWQAAISACTPDSSHDIRDLWTSLRHVISDLEDVTLVELTYHAFTHMPGNSYRWRYRFLLYVCMWCPWLGLIPHPHTPTTTTTISWKFNQGRKITAVGNSTVDSVSVAKQIKWWTVMMDVFSLSLLSLKTGSSLHTVTYTD